MRRVLRGPHEARRGDVDRGPRLEAVAPQVGAVRRRPRDRRGRLGRRADAEHAPAEAVRELRQRRARGLEARREKGKSADLRVSGLRCQRGTQR